MKKLLFSVIALAAFGTISAQEEATAAEGYTKGDYFITGGLGFYSNKNDVVKNSSLTIAPSVGYFVTGHIALGASFTYGHQTDKYINSDVKSTRNNYAPSMFGRYYFTPANKFSLFAHAAAGYSYTEYKSNGYSHDNTFTGMAGAGINYFITPHLALQANLGVIQYSSIQQNASANDDKNTNFSAGISLQNLLFGMTYKF